MNQFAGCNPAPDIVFTRHAVKRARKRFRLNSDESARRFLFLQLTSPIALYSSGRGGGAFSVVTPAATLIVRPQDNGLARGYVVMTCYPSEFRAARSSLLTRGPRANRAQPGRPHRGATMERTRSRDGRAAERRNVRRSVEHALSEHLAA